MPRSTGTRGGRGAARALELLRAGTPREVLARIVPDDPLRIRRVVAVRLRARGLLLDADQVLLRALARVARAAVHYRGRPALGTWLEGRVDEALDEILAAQAAGRPAAPAASAANGPPGAVELLARRIGLDPEATRRALARFHALPYAERDAFFRLVVEGEPAAGEKTRLARRAFDALLSARRAQ
ncbi:MAG: hypothetical protein O7B99_06200 [Planctomycetota bacterium]|nr:hypothetical protein [Planctomycetota bacterium]